MGSVSGTTNPTNLREIARKHASIVKLELAGKPHFQISRLDFSSYKLRGNERVVVLARAGTTSRRYEVGTVSVWRSEPLDLDDIDPSQILRFRILIRTEDSPRLIATAENLRCAGDGDVESLMPIVSMDLGQRLWRVLINEDGPTLQCNALVFPSGASAENYVPFRTLVLPEALSQVLQYISKDPEMLNAEGTIWADWASWMNVMKIETPPDDEDLHTRWISEATARFCDHFKCAQDLSQTLHKDTP